MSFTPNFSVSESLGTPSQITLTDTSTGTDNTLTSRRVYLQLADGSYLTTEGNTNDYEVWSISDSSITLDVLPRSEAINIIVEWMVNTVALYQKIILSPFKFFDILFGYQRVQNLTSSPKLMDNPNFYGSMVKFIVNLFCADTAVTYGDDIFSAQEAFDRNYGLIQNVQVFF